MRTMSRSVRARRAGVGVVVAMVASLLMAAPAQAAEDGAPSGSFEEILESVAPDITDETNTQAAPDLAEGESGVDVTPVTLEDATAEGAPVPADVIDVPNFSIDFADGVEGETRAGLTEITTDDASSEAYVQPTDAGVRVLTATLDSSGPSTYEYTVDVPVSAELVQVGELYFLEDATQVYGVLHAPWALDAEGNAVPTSYTWEGGTLTQHLNFAQDTVFPVIADPFWTYSYKFATNKTPAYVKSLLKLCFNCFFPVDGAPRAFPTKGQILPLRFLAFNMQCQMGGVASVGTTLYQYSFLATKNHVDGLGSSITFSFRSDKALHVTAKIGNFWLNTPPTDWERSTNGQTSRGSSRRHDCDRVEGHHGLRVPGSVPRRAPGWAARRGRRPGVPRRYRRVPALCAVRGCGDRSSRGSVRRAADPSADTDALENRVRSGGRGRRDACDGCGVPPSVLVAHGPVRRPRRWRGGRDGAAAVSSPPQRLTEGSGGVACVVEPVGAGAGFDDGVAGQILRRDSGRQEQT
ncbi:hypothetical protein [Microbacterium sp. HJ5]